MLVSSLTNYLVTQLYIIARSKKGRDNSKQNFKHDLSADYARDSQLPSMKHSMGMAKDTAEYSNYGVHNSMLSKAYGDAAPYGKIYFV